MLGINGSKSDESVEKHTIDDQSYFHSIGKNPLIYRTIGQQLSLTAKEFGDREAFVFVEEGKRITYGELLVVADRLAAGFHCLGLTKGDRLAILTPSVSTWPIAMYAAARAGLIAVHLNPTPDAQNIEASLKKVSAKALIASEKIGPYNYYDKLLEIIPDLKSFTSGTIQNEKLPFLSTIIIDSEKNYTGTCRLVDIMSMATISQINDIENFQKNISPDSGCSISFTSGFTGPPKAVLVSHLGTINIGNSQSEWMSIRNSTLCAPIPFCHMFASGVAAITSLCCHITLVVPSSTYDPVKVLHALSVEKCKCLAATPQMLMDLVSKQKILQFDIKSINITVGASQMPQKLIKDLKEVLGMKLLSVGFGMTEYGGLCSLTVPEDSDEVVAETVGRLLKHMEAKVIDDNGMMVPFGTPGQLCIRGYSTMICYWDDEKKTRAVLGTDGWLNTGDYFILDRNGYGRIVARLDEMICKGNEKIFSREIENVLGKCPRIAEVYVVGVPDDHLGEELCAFVRLHDGFETIFLEDLHEFCQGKLTPSHIPRYIKVVEEFPKTISGKIKKLELKRQFSTK